MTEEKKYIFNLTGRKRVELLLLLLFILSIAGILILQSNYYSKSYNERDLKRFERTLHQKEAKLNLIFDELQDRFEKDDPMEVLDEYSSNLRKLSSDEGLMVFYYELGTLKYWSENEVWLRNRWLPRLKAPVYQTLNGTYVTVVHETDDYRLLGLIKIKTTYPYENTYLENSFEKSFKLAPEIELSRQPDPVLMDVKNSQGQYLFSLDLSRHLKNNQSNITISLLLFFMALLTLFSVLSIRTDRLYTQGKGIKWLYVSIIIIIVNAVLVIYFEFPRIIYESGLFQPDVFASLYFPSLGHLLLFVLLVAMMTLFFYWFQGRSNGPPESNRYFIAIIYLVLATLWFIFVHHIGETLVLDSTISFEAYKLDALSEHTFIGLLILLIAYLVFCLLMDKSFKTLGLPLRRKDYMLLTAIGLFIQLPFLVSGFMKIEWLTPVFYLLITLSLIFLRISTSRIRFSRFFVLLLAIAVFLTIDLQTHTSQKKNAQVEIELAKLSTEHDAVAEMLFPELSRNLKADSSLAKRLSYQIIDGNLTLEYLQRTYFSGYWTRYDLQLSLCRPPDSVQIDMLDDLWYPCYPYFYSLVEEEGIRIENSDFYFLNNLNGRISYIGAISYETISGEITLFFELNTKIVSEELGYPTLLLRKEQIPDGDFSYAKYNNGFLINSGGNYSYRRSSDYYTNRENTFELVNIGGYDHTVFNADPENTVIVSIPEVSFIHKLISFSYLFAFVFSIFALAFLVVSASRIKATVTWDFKNKIQYSMIGILFLTFIVICAGTIYFVIQQYQSKHEDNLDHIMRSLYIEILHKVEYEDDLRNWTSESYYNMDELLRKFSNVFFTDINLYDRRGMMLATSRNELFDQQLLSNRMNRDAFEKLSFESYSNYIHTESIGGMTYQSAYVPVYNNENTLLAYLNLPYFTEPEVLTQEITNLVVAILNTYVILILLILFMSVFLADRITQPLRFIQSRIAQLSLSQNNEKIVYKGRDEIAGLVDEYNYMVDQLEKSAELLAQSERETAWREMAKQIAHEIKNPLTPMKLNVQHLQRMISQDKENIEERVEKVSQNLIEQIDMLASIANEFSDFAKMPKAKNKKINLVKRLKNVKELFANSDGVNLAIDTSGITEVYAYGDPEQFQRVIINLVKNGIQAIPEDREKEIKISMEHGPEDTVVIAISDNGKGIPTAIQDKLFQPNFTTKSSGMGMGLAISANIIKSINGNIWYSTRENEGTTFFIKLPVFSD